MKWGFEDAPLYNSYPSKLKLRSELKCLARSRLQLPFSSQLNYLRGPWGNSSHESDLGVYMKRGLA